MARVLILFGAPGAGKGTQALRLAAELSLPHVSTGDLFRENLGQETELGLRARKYMEAGELVPDELVTDMLLSRVARPDCAGGYLLDGYPRTAGQAESLEAALGSDTSVLVLCLQVRDEVIVERAAGRLLCRGCDAIAHAVSAPPEVAGVCDHCGGELYQREDDRPEVVAERLRVYHEETAPLVDYYRERGLLREVDGERSPDEVFASLMKQIRAGEAG